MTGGIGPSQVDAFGWPCVMLTLVESPAKTPGRTATYQTDPRRNTSCDERGDDFPVIGKIVEFSRQNCGFFCVGGGASQYMYYI